MRYCKLVLLTLGIASSVAVTCAQGLSWSGEAQAPRLAKHYLDAATVSLENFALARKGATIAATHERNAVTKLLDGDPVTGYDAPFGQEQVSLTLTLPEPKTFDCLYWEYARGYDMDLRQPRDYDLLVSSDGENWETVKQVRGFVGQFNYELFEPVTARHLRLDMLKTSGGDGVVIWALRLHYLGDSEPADWWQDNWQWRARLSPIKIPASTEPRVVRARLDFSKLATRPGRLVQLDSIRVVEHGPDSRIVADNQRQALPHVFTTGEGFDWPSNQNGTLLWIASPTAVDQERQFEVYFAYSDEADVPAAEPGEVGLDFRVEPGNSTVDFEVMGPGLVRLEVYDEFNQLHGQVSLAENPTGQLPGVGPFSRYWVWLRGLEGPAGVAWVPQSPAAPGTLGLSLPRFVWARGEALPVEVSLGADSEATTVQVSLLQRGRVYSSSAPASLEVSGEHKRARLELSTEHLAHGRYSLVAIAEGPQGIMDTRRWSVFVAQPREDCFPYGQYTWSNLVEGRAEDDWKLMASLGTRLTLSRDLDTAVRYRIQCIPKLGNVEHEHHPDPQAPFMAVTSDGEPQGNRLSYASEELRTRYLVQLRNTLTGNLGHPGFAGVIFWHDDGQLANKWERAEPGVNRFRWYPQDYSAITVADCQAKTGQPPPTPQETPKRTGVVPDDDLWLQWMTYRCDDYYAGLTRVLMEEKARTAPEVGLIEVHGGGGANPYVALSDGLYPPYDQAACDWVGTYFYPGGFWPTLDYLWQIQVGWMGNRGRKTWMTTGLHTTWAPLAIKNKFHMVLAAGYDALIHFIYDSEVWAPETEAHQILVELGQLVDDYEALYNALEPGKPRVAVLYPFTSVVFGMAGEVFDYLNHRHFQTTARTLVRNHVPIAVVAEEEVRDGILDQYDMLIIPPIQALRQSVYDRVQEYAAGGKPVLLLEGSQVAIPGAQVVDYQALVTTALQSSAGRPLLKPGTSDAVVSELHVDDTAFVYVVNAYADRWIARREDRAYAIFTPLNPDPHLEEWYDVEERKGVTPRPMQELEVQLSGENAGAYLYDLYAHQEVPWPAEGVQLTLPPGEGRLLAAYHSQVGDTQLEAPEQATQGEVVNVQVVVLDAVGVPFAEPVPLKLTVRQPDGEISVYTRSLLARGGLAKVTLPLAVNDPSGEWQLEIRNLATGERITKTLRVQRSGPK